MNNLTKEDEAMMHPDRVRMIREFQEEKTEHKKPLGKSLGKPSKYSGNKSTEKYNKNKESNKESIKEGNREKSSKKLTRDEIKEVRRLKKEKNRVELERQHALNPPKPKLKQVVEEFKRQQEEDRQRIDDLEDMVKRLEKMVLKEN